MSKVIELKAGQQIKTPYDSYSPVITIGTASDFFKNGTRINEEGKFGDKKIPFHLEGWKIWEANCGRDWRKHYMWANQSGACLTSNYPGKAAEMERKAQAYKDAVMLNDGDIVECEGFKFKVYCVKRDVSDPVHFTLID